MIYLACNSNIFFLSYLAFQLPSPRQGPMAQTPRLGGAWRRIALARSCRAPTGLDQRNEDKRGGRLLGGFCRYQFSTLFNYHCNTFICGSFLTRLLPLTDDWWWLLSTPKETWFEFECSYFEHLIISHFLRKFRVLAGVHDLWTVSFPPHFLKRVNTVGFPKVNTDYNSWIGSGGRETRPQIGVAIVGKSRHSKKNGAFRVIDTYLKICQNTIFGPLNLLPIERVDRKSRWRFAESWDTRKKTESLGSKTPIW